VLEPPGPSYEAIVANPPYVRHHRIKPEAKQALQRFVRSYTGLSLDARAGLHIYFLLRALQLLAPNGRWPSSCRQIRARSFFGILMGMDHE